VAYLSCVSIVPVYGHEALRARLRAAAAADRLPASILLHGPRGVGKQRVGLWLGQLLLCDGAAPRPCGRCQHCRYAVGLVHPDLHWYFPRPRPKETDASPQTIREDYAEVIAERVNSGALYAPADGTEGIFVAAVRALLLEAAMSPALARRKVFVVGDAERMVPQEGAEEAANAFLKLLEEPPADTTLVLTSSEPGALLPTIRSRVVALRVPPLTDREVRAFLDDPAVERALETTGAPATRGERLGLAQGAPGALLGATGLREALEHARRLVTVAGGSDPAERLRLAFIQGSSRARGSFAQMLDALTVVLHERVRDAAGRDEAKAAAAARAMEAVERAKALATRNVNPQLVSAALMRDIGAVGR
jgi:DNA polymerase-3 subunit delta'